MANYNLEVLMIFANNVFPMRFKQFAIFNNLQCKLKRLIHYNIFFIISHSFNIFKFSNYLFFKLS
jgi:hypothetical protein